MHQQDNVTNYHTWIPACIYSLLIVPLYIHRSLRASSSLVSSSCFCSSSGPVAMEREIRVGCCSCIALSKLGDSCCVVYYTPPPYGSGGGHSNPAPTHGGAPPANCGAPPSGGHHSTPSTPHKSPPRSNPPVNITPPRSPTVTVPSPPLPYDPNSPPYTLIWGLFGWWGSVGSAFGVTCTVPGFGAKMNLLQALSNTRTDGYGELHREGTAALLNSMAHTKYPYTTAQVKERFAAALSSNKAAEAQASLFKMANEGKIKARL